MNMGQIFGLRLKVKEMDKEALVGEMKKTKKRGCNEREHRMQIMTVLRSCQTQDESPNRNMSIAIKEHKLRHLYSFPVPAAAADSL
ncbi:hypothetical protein OIU74_001401 [Salix koriyanagi]|uniref:Uncharacterized protein n=1 Tax=Salix koriyanagi TaxID=2511006 RepID=A0A9Q0X3X8_9ROSI|nr:hypothetical protein OIU74_001401 [Salix koriyanagi]